MPRSSTVASAVLAALHDRRSIARLVGTVADDDLRTMIAAAVAAPNHKMTQPWRFTVLRDAARERLGALWGGLMAAESGLDPAAAEAYGRREAGKPMRAPAIVVVSTTTAADRVVADEDYAATSAAIQNLLLAAEALGIGAIWRTGAMGYRPEIKAHLGLAPTDRIVGFVYVGEVQGERPAAPPRDAEAVTVWRD